MKFLIIGQPRTGSTLLHTMLIQNENIKMEGELFHKEITERKKAHKINSSEIYYQGGEFITFLKNNLWNDENLCIGFKYFPFYSVEHDPEIFIKQLIDNEVFFIHAFRRNKFDIWLSHERAKQKKQFAIFEGESESKILLKAKEVQPESIHRELNEICNRDNKITEYCKGDAYERIYYDDLIKNPNLDKIFDRLGVNKMMPTYKMSKQNNDHPSVILKNFSDIKSYFKKTDYAPFFDTY